MAEPTKGAQRMGSAWVLGNDYFEFGVNMDMPILK